MNYFNPYPLEANDTITAAWNSQVTETAQTPWLAHALAECASDLFPRFAACYAQLCSLPRNARRALQRQLAHSRELTGVLQEQRQTGRALQRKLAYSLGGAALLLALGQGVAAAATIKVTTNNPKINDGDGKCSLIEAMINANDGAKTHNDCAAGDPGLNNTIVLPTRSTHRLTDVYTNFDFYGPTGLPAITSSITIAGNGSTISRTVGAPQFRLLAVSRSGDLTLNQVTVTGGEVSKTDYNSYGGGGIFNFGRLTLQNSNVSGNSAFGYGGGIVNHYGTLIVRNSTVARNTSRYSGGGLSNITGLVRIKDSTISGNTAGRAGGGGIENGGRLAIEESTISENTAGERGGGIAQYGYYFTIRNSTISGNRADKTGGGIYSFAPYSLYNTLSNSTVSGNSAVHGGGIFNVASLKLSNSTISQNTATYDGGGISNAYDGSLAVENSTISGNAAGQRGGGIYNLKRHGNLYKFITLSRSLISGNEATGGPEVANYDLPSLISSGDFNLFGQNGDAGLYGFTPGPSDIVPAPRVYVSKILGPLKNNGGPTQTQALVKGSPAIDAIPTFDPECTGTDQRGVKRPRGHGCDIGAFEK